MNGISALQQYRQISTQSAIPDASPHQLVLMLFDGAIEKISAAKGKMMHGDLAQKGRLISGAIAIIETLNATLDHDVGGELAGNLARLYDYMARRLLQANAKNKPEYLLEVASLLREVREAWVAIPQDYRSPDQPPCDTALVTTVRQ